MWSSFTGVEGTGFGLKRSHSEVWDPTASQFYSGYLKDCKAIYIVDSKENRLLSPCPTCTEFGISCLPYSARLQIPTVTSQSISVSIKVTYVVSSLCSSFPLSSHLLFNPSWGASLAFSRPTSRTSSLTIPGLGNSSPAP